MSYFNRTLPAALLLLCASLQAMAATAPVTAEYDPAKVPQLQTLAPSLANLLTQLDTSESLRLSHQMGPNTPRFGISTQNTALQALNASKAGAWIILAERVRQKPGLEVKRAYRVDAGGMTAPSPKGGADQDAWLKHAAFELDLSQPSSQQLSSALAGALGGLSAPPATKGKGADPLKVLAKNEAVSFIVATSAGKAPIMGGITRLWVVPDSVRIALNGGAGGGTKGATTGKATPATTPDIPGGTRVTVEKTGDGEASVLFEFDPNKY